MNIGLLIGRFPPDIVGGAELQIKSLATELAKSGHTVTVFTRRYHRRPYSEVQDGYLIRRHDELPIAGLRMIWDIVPLVWQLARHNPQVDVLLCYQILNSGLIGMLAQALLGIPMVLSVRGSKAYRLRDSRFQHLVVPPILSRARRVVVQSKHILEDMLEQFQLAGENKLAESVLRKTVVIPNGISLENARRSQGRKVIFVGRLIKDKGVADLINSMKELPEYELIIVGDGPEREHLESISRGMAVTFTGLVMPSQVKEYLQQARILVLPSHSESFPNVIMEAMACGVPVVATRTGGIPSLVHHSETGYLFEIGDIEKMVSYIKCLMENDTLWKELSDQSLRSIQSFAWENITPQIEQLLLEVVEQK